jgi:uncharacterized protein (TIGR02147 family)
MQYESYHDLLQEEFERRKHVNSAYSLRAFARDLGVSPPRLSQVLSRKQGLSLEAARTLVQKLRISEAEREWFCDSVGALHSRSRSARNRHQERFSKYTSLAKTYTELQLEFFKVISDWYHFAILELTHLTEFESDPQWIASRLGITLEESVGAIERMKSMDFLIEENGRLVDRLGASETEKDIPSLALKKYNSQLLKKAMEAMYEQDVSEREYSSTILSIRKDRLPEFKQKIRKFVREFDQENTINHSANEKDAVYCLGIQFFGLTRRP